MNLKQAEQIRAARARHGRPGRGNPYPASLRRQALAYARSREAEGASLTGAARELGLAPQSLLSWAMTEETSPGFAPVVITTDSTEPTRIIVRAPLGLSIEGLDLDGVAALLRRLS